jgi:hypothetical protein
MTQLRIRKNLGKACTRAKYKILETLATRQTNQGKSLTQLSLSAIARQGAAFCTIAATTVIGIGNPADAYQIYFSRDIHPDPNDYGAERLPSTPLADAARNSFLKNLVNPETETFEGFAPGSNVPLSINFSGVTATFDGVGTILNLPTGIYGVGQYPISGNQFLETSTGFYDDSSEDRLLFGNPIRFSNPVAALGFYATGLDFQPEMSPTQLRFTRTDGSIFSFDIPTTSGIDTSVLYFGIIAENPSELFTTATFRPLSSRTNGFGLDDLTVASFDQVKPVPEPLTILGSLAAGGFGVALRRKYKQKQRG